jgi:hypothetical protein
MLEEPVRISWRDRLTDPWYVLPVCALAGAVLALALAIALEPDNGVTNSLVIAADATHGGAAAETPAVTPTPDPMAHYHDLGRGIDAYKITQASFRYYQDHQSYPFGAPGVHTLCADKAADAGCKFEPYLGPVPMDPRGNSVANGYWYQSDGLSYTLYMSMESGEGLDDSSCPSPRPKELADIAHLYCANVGPPRQ